MSEFKSFQPGVQTPPLLIQQTVEEHNRCLEFMGQDHCPARPLRTECLPLQALRSLLGGFGREIDIKPPEALPLQLALLMELQQRSLAFDMEQLLQFRGGITGLAFVHKLPRGFDQVAELGEPDPVKRPQPLIIKVRNLFQGIKLASVGITRPIAYDFELAEHRHGAGRVQCMLELLQCGNCLAVQKNTERCRIDGVSHLV